MYINQFAGTWQYFLDELGAYLNYYSDLAFFAGAAYDQVGDGVRDNDVVSAGVPSHIFFVLLRCQSGAPIRGTLCKDVLFLPYILPVADRNLNCLTSREYLFDNTARLRDIELLTGMQFFTDRQIWSTSEALQLRTWLPQSLWSVQ
ncbi:unnamed protein product [Gongylonema pulchrum]|uniref:Copine domain-containing protein n=1 Tax=Gongylonema pulchrum TaxID=637853 RepID=A0A183D0R1_9BILA|nr:unnamed protein product [Gongylonema pulchrum]